jgi:hypothetical protein
VRAHSVLIEAPQLYALDDALDNALSVIGEYLLSKKNLGVIKVMAGKTASER